MSEQSQTQDTPKAEVNAAAPDTSLIESPAIAPDHEAPKADAPKVEAPKVEAPKIEANAGAPGTAGKMLIMAPGDRAWRGEAGAKADADHAPAKRRFGAMAAVVALAIIAGAAGGAFATMGMMHTADAAATAPASGALEAAIARIDADVQQLKSGLDHTSKAALTQFNKTADRLDKIEKAQAEPSAKLAKLSEAVEKLRAAPAPAPVVAAAAPVTVTPAAPKEVTGSVTPPAVAAAAPAAAPATPAEARGRPPADGRGLGPRRCRLWRRADPQSPRNLGSLCRRPHSGPRPHRRHPQAGWPLGGRHRKGPDRRASVTGGDSPGCDVLLA